jgi:urease accessory protein
MTFNPADDVSSTEASAGRPAPLPPVLRGENAIRLDVTYDPISRTSKRIGTHEQGASRIRLPRAAGEALEAVMVNTGGGMLGGDHYQVSALIDAKAHATITTASGERVYRSDGPDTLVRIALIVEKAARLAWLPRETILFDGARLDRQVSVDLAASASLLFIETMALGRKASGEALTYGAWRDRWTIRRDGTPLFAEAIRLEGNLTEQLTRQAAAPGMSAMATILLICDGAEEKAEVLRHALAAHPLLISGAGGRDGLLLVRLMACDLSIILAAIAGLLPFFAEFSPPRGYP